MTPERRRQVEALCEAALGREAGESRAERLLDRPAWPGAGAAIGGEPGAGPPGPGEHGGPAPATDSRMRLASGTRLGPYEIVSLVGAGGMGEVYQARDTRLGRTVAVKVLPAGVAADPDRRRRFEHEARAASALNHPHICTLYDIGSERPTVPPSLSPDLPVQFLVMEHLNGQTLAARLGRGKLPLAEALEVGIQVADALSAAHRHGIVHRDLKPGNVMLTKGTAPGSGAVHAKLLDFGLAKLRAPRDGGGAGSSLATESAPVTTPGMLLGTLPYMAPEQVEGKETDARTDLWALGAMLYEMVTGTRAFTGESHANVAAAILEHEPPTLATTQPLTPPALERLVRRCLAKDPDARWESAADVADELRWIRDTGAAGAATPVQRHPSSVRRLALGVLAMLALIGVSAALTWRAGVVAGRSASRGAYPPVGTPYLGPRPRQALAYVADPTGRNENQVFLVRFPSLTDQRWVAGPVAHAPVWARNGRELFYIRGKNQPDQELVAHPIGPDGALAAEGRILFRLGSPNVWHYNPVPGFDVSLDGRRFLFVQHEDTPPPDPPKEIHIVENWFEELRAKVRGK